MPVGVLNSSEIAEIAEKVLKYADSSGQASAYSTQELTLSKCFKPWVIDQA
jgi:hypothetical protein